MSNIIIISILISITNIISSEYLEAESNFVKPQLERNNKINKGIWIKNSLKDELYGNSGNDFIFRANSLDVDNIVQNDFDAFADNLVQQTPLVSSYVERAKRSNNFKKKHQIKNNIIGCNGEKECIQKKMEDRAMAAKSKLIAKLKPSSVFNDYPYEVAILLGSNTQDTVKNIRTVKASGDMLNSVIPLNKNNDIKTHFDTLIVGTKNDIEANTSTLKKNMKNFESEVIKKIEIVEDFDRSNDNSSSNKIDRSIFDKEERIWHQNAPVLDTNSYKVVPKVQTDKNKPINERGLVKVLSMLTKTFKKIMKQHTEIKDIHNNLKNISDEVIKNIADVTQKFKHFEQKYSSLQDTNSKLHQFEQKMNDRDVYFKQKDKEMAQNLIEFENQQKKFLIQQRQFYNIQKLMLAQNEKINIKQNLIAKTQSEISHRQNNFARILKKAKQLYADNKHPNGLTTSTFRPNFVNKGTHQDYKITHTTTQSPVTTDPIKINLFSIPALKKIVNQDTMLLKEKDEQPVDDLVYKYYFNNTFIDSLMKSKILTSFVTNAENTEIARNAKAKRDEEEMQTTILFPLTVENKDGKLTREKRWIRHGQSKSKLRKSRGKNGFGNSDINDEKPSRLKAKRKHDADKGAIANEFKNDPDPFLNMAKNFCNEIGQHINEQVFGWCIEKALRRLQFIDLTQYTTKLMPIRDAETPAPPTDQINVPTDSSPTVPSLAPISTIVSSTTQSSQSASTVSLSGTTSYFPDNDELELRNYEFTPDPEGNVYFDGSVHTSDMAGLNSDGFSDLMLEAESNSRVEIDPLAFDLQAMRRDSLRRLAEMKKLAYG